MSNLSHQFDGQAKAIEDAQRRRFARKREPGFVGNGYWFWNYPNMVGAIGAGTITQTHSEQNENPVQELGENMGRGAENTEDVAGNNVGMGEGGTASVGTMGGSPA